MKAIKDYVEVMFKDFPKTKKTKELKNNILDTMETKYEDLLAEGKSEQEAVGIVIGQFGNIDELKKEYEIEIDENAEYLESYEAEEFVSHKKRSSVLIGAAIAAIILAVGVVAFNSDTAHESVTYIFMLLVIAGAVMVFIMTGLQSTKFKEITEGKYRLEGEDLVKYKSEYNRFLPSFQIAICIGVFLCIVGVTAPIITEDLLGLSENMFAAILFPCVALAVYLFVSFGVKYSMYNTLINPEKIQKEREDGENGWLYGVTMPLAAMAFLFIGFIYNAWHPGWLVFPVTAIATSAVVMILNNTKK